VVPRKKSVYWRRIYAYLHEQNTTDTIELAMIIMKVPYNRGRILSKQNATRISESGASVKDQVTVIFYVCSLFFLCCNVSLSLFYL
jgi:hypothetical protein